MAGTQTIGSTLTKIKSGDEGNNTIIGSLTSIGAIGVSSDEADTTTLDSKGGFKEFIATTKDAGEVALAGNIIDEATIEKMLALSLSQTLEKWEVAYPSGAKWAFTAFVKEFKDGDKTVDGLATWTATLRISGKPEYTASA